MIKRKRQREGSAVVRRKNCHQNRQRDGSAVSVIHKFTTLMRH